MLENRFNGSPYNAMVFLFPDKKWNTLKSKRALIKKKHDGYCTVEGCHKPYRAKGLCDNCYKKYQRGTLEGYVPSKLKEENKLLL
ncbi:hypothetical protein D3C74_322600 [compost metagenome]